MTRRDRELEFNLEWGDLAQYNGEVARGLVHTRKYAEEMRAKQEKYNELLRTESKRNA